jgi:hypothetical protein
MSKRYVIIFDGPNANFRDNQHGCLWCGKWPTLPAYDCFKTPIGEKQCGTFCEECTAEGEARKHRKGIWE